MAFLVAEHSSRHVGFGRHSTEGSAVAGPGLESTGSVVVAHGPCCSKASKIRPGSEPVSLALVTGFFSTVPPEKSSYFPCKFCFIASQSEFSWWDGSVSICDLMTLISSLNITQLDRMGRSHWPLLASSRGCGEEVLTFLIMPP